MNPLKIGQNSSVCVYRISLRARVSHKRSSPALFPTPSTVCCSWCSKFKLSCRSEFLSCNGHATRQKVGFEIDFKFFWRLSPGEGDLGKKLDLKLTLKLFEDEVFGGETSAKYVVKSSEGRSVQKKQFSSRGSPVCRSNSIYGDSVCRFYNLHCLRLILSSWGGRLRLSRHP
jgi:hypothetical protein